MRRGCFLRVIVMGAALLLPCASAAWAQDGDNSPAVGSADNAGGSDKIADKTEMAKALAEVQRNIQLSDSRRAELAAEVDRLKNDENKLTQALAEAAQAERAASAWLNASAARMADLMVKKQAQQKILDQRRAEMAEILAGLEKLGFNPPPAMLADAGDAAQSLHAAAMMGALVPQMKSRVLLVQAEMDRLNTIQTAMNAEQMQLNAKAEKQKEEQARLNMLLREKAQMQAQKQRNIAQEEDNRERLASKAQSLQDLMDEVGKMPPAADNENKQIEFSAKFTSLKGSLPKPVEGAVLTAFGKKGADGRPAQGETIAARPGAAVLSPADGIARYAGDFRSYGKILILDVGEDYYMVLAGMGKIHVAQGQFLLQGEPIGAMAGLPDNAKDGYSAEKSAPQLYVELRHENKPVNPAPWWAADNAGTADTGG